MVFHHIFFPLDTVAAFMKRMKLGQYHEKDPDADKEAATREEQEKAEAEAIPVGARCEATVPGTMPRRGTVMYVGKWGHC